MNEMPNESCYDTSVYAVVLKMRLEDGEWVTCPFTRTQALKTGFGLIWSVIKKTVTG
jgi:hypothetical protein